MSMAENNKPLKSCTGNFFFTIVSTHLFAIFLSVVLFLAVTFTPTAAHADFENPSVTTVAQMQTDNSLHVSTQRSYVFDDQYSIVTIPLSRTSSESTLSVESVRLIQLGEDGSVVRSWWTLEEERFQPAWRELFSDTEGLTEKVRRLEDEQLQRSRKSNDGSDFFTLPKGDAYAFDSRNDRIYIFLTPTSLNTVIECNYNVEQAALVYEDVAELYWDYVSHWLDADSQNVNVQIQLPVPEDAEVVEGETIRAWGHGPEGTLEVEIDGTIDYTVKEVKESQYAQAHVVFPSSWLTNMPVLQKLKKSGLRLSDAVLEESEWTDSYSASRTNDIVIDIAQVLLCIILICLCLCIYFFYGRETEEVDASSSDFLQKFNRIDAAIINRLLRNNHWSNDDFGCELITLSNEGVIDIANTNSDACDVRFKITPSTKTKHLTDRQRLSLEILFDIAADGYQSVSAAEVAQSCERKPYDIKEAIEAWQKLLDEEVDASNLFDTKSKKYAVRACIIGVILVVIGLFEWLVLKDAVSGLILIISGGAICAIAYNIPRRTPLGCAVTEKIAKDDTSQPDDFKDYEWVKLLSKALDKATSSADSGLQPPPSAKAR